MEEKPDKGKAGGFIGGAAWLPAVRLQATSWEPPEDGWAEWSLWARMHLESPGDRLGLISHRRSAFPHCCPPRQVYPSPAPAAAFSQPSVSDVAATDHDWSFHTRAGGCCWGPSEGADFPRHAPGGHWQAGPRLEGFRVVGIRERPFPPPLPYAHPHPHPAQVLKEEGSLTAEQHRKTIQKDSMMPEMPTTHVSRRKRITPKMFCRQGR